MIPEIPAPMITTLNGRASSTDRSSMANLSSGETAFFAVGACIFSSGSACGIGLGLPLKTRDRRFIVNQSDGILESGIKVLGTGVA